jgi:membrane associated rhomboid family serine protease
VSAPGEPEPPVVVWRGRDAAAAREHALVLTALGIEHATGRDEGWHVIAVASRDERRAREELLRFDAENAARPPAEEAPALTSGAHAAALYALVLGLLWICQRGQALGRDWEAAGENVAGALPAGEWWRAITALTLHADAAHLLSNVVFGAAFVWFSAQLAGTGVALAAILAAGALGNAARALLPPAGYHALGASTAVFGALGLLAGLHGRRRARARQARLRRWTPVVAALLLLGYLGTEGMRTDVPAHVTGFLAGLLLGLLLAAPLHEGPPGRHAQWVAGLAAAAALALAWSSAFAAAPAAG